MFWPLLLPPAPSPEALKVGAAILSSRRAHRLLSPGSGWFAALRHRLRAGGALPALLRAPQDELAKQGIPLRIGSRSGAHLTREITLKIACHRLIADVLLSKAPQHFVRYAEPGPAWNGGS
jgi:hypothetical protein